MQGLGLHLGARTSPVALIDQTFLEPVVDCERPLNQGGPKVLMMRLPETSAHCQAKRPGQESNLQPTP